MKKRLSEFKIKEKGKVREIGGEPLAVRRFFDMGLTPGVEVELIKVAPLGDPIEIRLRNYRLSLRKLEASTILMEVGK